MSLKTTAAYTRAAAALAAMMCIAVLSCTARAEQPGEKALAYVGGEPVTDLELEVLARGALSGRDEAGLLDYAIRRRALVQRALKDGLFKDPGYWEEMRRAREDALVRTLIEKKSKELAAGISVTDEELAVFASRMCYTVIFLRSEFGELKDAERFVARGRSKRARKWEDELTVSGCEGLGPLMLDAIFSLEPGEEKIVPRGRRFTVIRLEEKQKTAKLSQLPDTGKIRDYLLKKKTAEALDDWVDRVVGAARVRYVGGAGKTN